jgi:hypothetical protein
VGPGGAWLRAGVRTILYRRVSLIPGAAAPHAVLLGAPIGRVAKPEMDTANAKFKL